MTAARYQDLQAAILDHVTVDWRNGTARVTFLASGAAHGPHAVRVGELLGLHLERGAAASRIVREASYSASKEVSVLSVTMESGEVMRIEAGSIALDGTG